MPEDQAINAPIDSIKAANAATGGLSITSKMRGYSYGIPAIHCSVGSTLAKKPGTVCSRCYALGGNYVFPSVKLSQARRFALLRKPGWIDGMVYLINARYPDGGEFRWHDSGDLQSVEHLQEIAEVCRATPTVDHWMPTREQAIVRLYLRLGYDIPANLIVRISATMIGAAPPPIPDHPRIGTSTVGNGKGRQCPAYHQNGSCNGPAELASVKATIKAGPGSSKASKERHGKATRDLARWDLSVRPIDCRSCWDPCGNVNYPLH